MLKKVEEMFYSNDGLIFKTDSHYTNFIAVEQGEKMKKYIFDRNEFNWSEDFYKLIKDKFNIPDWFGENADALWDMLTGFIETPCEVIFKNFDRKENEYNERNINLILNCFKDAEKANPTKFKVIFE